MSLVALLNNSITLLDDRIEKHSSDGIVAARHQFGSSIIGHRTSRSRIHQRIVAGDLFKHWLTNGTPNAPRNVSWRGHERERSQTVPLPSANGGRCK